ncbi:NAD(P)H-dependent FMN reductase [Cnuella takakiae]|uniref:NAD(P)H-dependent FMN reductase n=1 Tax=Cnuella takakiae TaxID=1302690 RepID=A0A1M4XXH2_9BACT|nr:NAD(P)H-dependent oxidoreductase [Cnuella takakiae]OLY92974.1 NADPH-dependent FMN reductase [Cnuella takakiae]SHE97993.1 NAD(P)H-dependent FMN reductase [Cnuella takakiae]
MKIEIISGSPRANSNSHRVALFLQQQISQQSDAEVGLVDLREHHLPPMQDVFRTAADAPEHLRPLAERFFAADAFVIVTPEYNGSYSPAMQNLFDHFPKQHHKAFGLVTASTGSLGGMRAAMQLQQFVLAIFGNPSPYMLIIPQMDKKFDAAGTLLDPAFQRNTDLFVQEFLWLAGRLSHVDVGAGV